MKLSDKEISHIENSAVEILRALACSFEDQVMLFPDYVTPADELAQLFGDLEDVYLEVFLKNSVSNQPAFKQRFEELKKHFDHLQRQPDDLAWSSDALKNSTIWSQIRSEAKLTLESIGKLVEKPDLGFVTYVPAKGR